VRVSHKSDLATNPRLAGFVFFFARLAIGRLLLVLGHLMALRTYCGEPFVPNNPDCSFYTSPLSPEKQGVRQVYRIIFTFSLRLIRTSARLSVACYKNKNRYHCQRLSWRCFSFCRTSYYK
jgi:hypothetical protein